MGKFVEKIKDFFTGKFVYKPKKKPAQLAGGEEPQAPPKADAPSAQSATQPQSEKQEGKPKEQE